ncbi:MAG: pseudaminic acid biosynthesis-associated methylase [Betaproteobacteria bacterium]|nr:pseudaminic acid biosynthesis-associated methylase [Betaproteobacteria bacterium]
MNDKNFKTEQEAFWAGEFGNEYIGRNDAPELIAANLSLFSDILKHTRDISSVIEFGANIGMNLRALHQLLPTANLSAIEINANAADELRALGYVDVRHQSILEYTPQDSHDLTLIKTVLIHIHPDRLPVVYDALYASSRKYICVVEYYNPTPVSIPYRGHSDRLFKRDFAGEILDRHPDLRLVSYGFKYRRDPVFLHSDVTWFLMEKTL